MALVCRSSRASEGVASKVAEARDALLWSVDRIERHLRRRQLIVFHDRAYRLPVPSLDQAIGLDSRRADFVAWCLADYRIALGNQLRRPRQATYAELALVHTPEYLESLWQPETLARIFAVDSSEVPVDEMLRTVRTACGGTIEAARLALANRQPILNTLGGFHHAAPNHGGGFCAVNDVAVAIAVLRKDGYRGQINVLDLDAHPPDGTAECLRSDPAVWIGSLSGADWGAIAGVDEVLLPAGCGDAEYLAALSALLSRMPACGLAFVIAGGDVLAGDQLGGMSLTMDGVRRRDIGIAERFAHIPTVWLPGGGYHPQAWKILAQVGFILAGRTRARIRPRYDPLASRFARIARKEQNQQLAEEPLTLEELEGSLWKRSPPQPRLLGFYSPERLEYALARYGVMGHLEHLGYRDIRAEVMASAGGDAIRILGRADSEEHLLIEAVLERRHIAEWDFLFVNWLALRHPRAEFSAARPRLPGQDAPGLGLAREMIELLAQVARRLSLDGVAFRPSWYHTAYTARYRGRFIDAKRQGRFEAMTRDFAGIPILEVTNALAEGRGKLNGRPYSWEPDDMAYWLGEPPPDDEVVVAEREASHFAIEPRPSN
jgi:acetoin utilization deacetylase AcuC-like enzyme